MKKNYFNFRKWDECSILLTNDLGAWVFVSETEFEQIVADTITPESTCYQELSQKGFIYENKDVFLQQARAKMMNSKDYLFGATSLQIFVLTNECNASCVYCQAQSKASVCRGKMDINTAYKALGIAFQTPNPSITIEFQGGEPLLNFLTMKQIVERAELLKVAYSKVVRYTLVSNLSLLTDEMIAFFKQYSFGVSTSLDGPEKLHNKNRPFHTGGGTYEKTIDGIKRLQSEGVDIGAIQTTTKYSLAYAKEIVHEYQRLGLHSVFIRPLTPLGLANDAWSEIGYSAEDFIAFYKEALLEIIAANENGYKMSEGHASILLAKVLAGYARNYMELRSPCGAAFGQVAYYYDGSIFTCDEGRMLAEMGDNAFLLGQVDTATYDSIMNCKVCRTVAVASVLESAPTCHNCIYQPYCGVCPVINYALYGDVFSKLPNNYRCQIYGGILDSIFNILKGNNPVHNTIFQEWSK